MSDQTSIILVEVIPVEEEQEDLVSLTLANETRDELQQALEAEGIYTVNLLDDPSSRGVGELIQVAADLTQQFWAHKVELGLLFTAFLKTFESLSKHRRIDEIELSRGDVKVSAKGIDRATLQKLIEDFTQQTEQQKGPVKVTAQVSKKKKGK